MASVDRDTQNVMYNTARDRTFYSSATTFTDSNMDDVTRWLSKSDAIAKIPVKQITTFNICDYGCSDGVKSLPFVRKVIDRVKNLHGKDQQILLIYEDQADNNFSAIFQIKVYHEHVHAIIRDRLSEDSQVKVLACGASFYTQCLPDDFINIGICSFAAHWLSYSPCEVTSAIYVQYNGTQEEIAQLAKVAGEDWNRFLLHRAKELRTGGYLVIVLDLVKDGDSQIATPRPASHPQEGCSMFDPMSKVKQEMAQEGLVSKAEASRMYAAEYSRGEDEIRAPFNDPASTISLTGLELVSIERKKCDCPIYAQYLRNVDQKGQSAAGKLHATKMAQSCKAIYFTSVLGAMSEQRPLSERQKLAELYFDKVQEKIAEEPSRYGFGSSTFHVVVRKI